MRAVPRLGVLWCPNWPVAAAGAAADEAVAVLHANRVIAVSRAAEAEGIAIGLRRREAQARCPHLRLVAHDPARESRLFDTVVGAVGALVPRVEVSEPGMISFLSRGPSRYFGGDQAMGERLLAEANAAVGPSLGAVGGFGLGVADGRFAASIAARAAARRDHGRGTDGMSSVSRPRGAAWVVAPGTAAEFLAPLSVRLLTEVGGLPDDLVGLLQRLGIQRLGQLAELPAADVLARFGHPGVFARAIAGGGDDRPPDTIEPPPGRRVERPFEEPVQHVDTLVFVARQLVDELVGQLSADGTVCTRLVVTAETDHGETNERLWYRPSGLSAAAMVERVRWQLDAWAQREALTAGVALLRLEPVEVRPDNGIQLGLWGGRTQADEWAARAVARLATLAGEQQVLVPAWRGGRQPADAYTWVSAITADLAEPGERLARPAGPWPGMLPTPTPAVVHPQPQEITVVDVDGAPVRVNGRGLVSAAPAVVGGEPVTAWAGPWPLEERWWDGARTRRAARFQLHTASGRLLLATIERQRWWLVAEYA